MDEETIYRNIEHDITITIDKDKPEENIFFMKIGEKWSINRGKDLCMVIKAIGLEDWTLLKDTYTKSAILHDLYDVGMVTKEQWETI